MAYQSYIALPTKRILHSFYEDTVGVTEASYELDHIVAKLIELIDEARNIRGESPATPVWQEAFIKSIEYEGMTDYVDPLQDKILGDALRKLYRGVLAVFMENDHHIHPDANMSFCRFTQGDILVGIFYVDYLTQNDVESHRKDQTIPGAVPWKN